jgi:hypothetical protein
MPSSPVPSRRHPVLALAALLAASAGGADDRPPDQAGARWSLEAGQSGVYDSNIDHDTPARADYGVVFMGAAAWQNRLARPSLSLRYEAALHRYADSPRWNRLSQRGEASFEKRLSKRWTSETRGEVSLKGSSEDRELSNQYTLLQEVYFRVLRGLELRAYGQARLKRYPAPDQDRDATNTYAGTALRARLGPARLEVGSRYEDNAARADRRDYQRWVHAAELAAPLGGRDVLDVELKLYDQQYPSRPVGDGPAEGHPRLDRRLVASVAWAHRFREDLGFEVEYKHDRRTSNEPDKGFDAHQVGLSFLYRFDRPRSGTPEPPPR